MPMKVVAKCPCGQEFVSTPSVESEQWITVDEYKCFKCGGRVKVLDAKHKRSEKVYINRLSDYR